MRAPIRAASRLFSQCPLHRRGSRRGFRHGSRRAITGRGRRSFRERARCLPRPPTPRGLHGRRRVEAPGARSAAPRFSRTARATPQPSPPSGSSRANRWSAFLPLFGRCASGSQRRLPNGRIGGTGQSRSESCRSEAVARFAAKIHAERVGVFRLATQWIADCQLGRAAAEARARGMAVGLYRDLAVRSGCRRCRKLVRTRGRCCESAGRRSARHAQTPGARTGYCRPLNPMALRDEAPCASYADLVRANMPPMAGGLAIDHVWRCRHL